MIGSLFCILAGALLMAVAIASAVGPVRLLAALVAVPIMWALVLVSLLVIWLALRFYGSG
jgi:hypothetical protein